MIPDGYEMTGLEVDATTVSVIFRSEEGRVWRRAISPRDDLSWLPESSRSEVAALMTPERTAAYAASVTPIVESASFDDLKAMRIAEAYAESQMRFAASTVSVMVNGSVRQYGCDPATRENITAINTAIGRAPSLVPNPRHFTPRGESPVLTTHDEFLAIYLAGIAEGDRYYAAYYTHKIAIKDLTTADDVAAYDLSTGWPS